MFQIDTIKSYPEGYEETTEVAICKWNKKCRECSTRTRKQTKNRIKERN